MGALTKERKNDIEGQIVDMVASALEQGQLGKGDPSQIANFVLDRIDALTTEEELLQFLTELSTKWPLFKNLITLEKGEIKDEKEDVVAANVEKLVESGNLEEAISLAKTMTQT